MKTASADLRKLADVPPRTTALFLPRQISGRLVPDLVLCCTEFLAGSTKARGQVAFCVACAKAALTVVIKWTALTTYERLVAEACRYAFDRFAQTGAIIA